MVAGSPIDIELLGAFAEREGNLVAMHCSDKAEFAYTVHRKALNFMATFTVHGMIKAIVHTGWMWFFPECWFHIKVYRVSHRPV